jgi:peptidyl-prolyl cis-trans isomerase A (cyclophilin A)
MRAMKALTMTTAALLLASGCGKGQPAKPQGKQAAPATQPAITPVAAPGAAAATPPAAPGTATPPAAPGTAAAPPAATPPAAAPPAEVKPATDSPQGVVALAQQLVTNGDMRGLAGLSTRMSSRIVARIPPERIKEMITGDIGAVELNGGRAVVQVTGPQGTRHVVTYRQGDQYRLDLMKSMRWQDVDPGAADPLNKPLTLAEATEGIEGTGALYAKLETSMGTFTCRMLTDVAPNTVANFVGLARGKRGWLDPKTQQWVKRPFYDGLSFHRVIPDFMIQGGDPAGNGTGGPGYSFADEFDLNVRHTKGGLLSMANRGPNTNGSQFFLTEVATPHLDDNHAVFGECDNVEAVKQITRVPATASKPNTPVTIKTLTFFKK